MKVILDLDLIMFNEREDASRAKERILDMHEEETFEKFIGELFPDGATTDEISNWIIRFDCIFDKYFTMQEEIERRSYDI